MTASPSAALRLPFARRLLLLTAAVLFLTCLMAPLVSWALTAIVGTAHRFSFPRVYDRVLQVLAVVAVLKGRRWLGLTSWAAFGLGDRTRRADLWRGVALAVGGGLMVFACMHWAGVLTIGWRYPLEKGVRKALAGIAAAAIVGTGEELLFRGLLLYGLAGQMRRGPAVAWVTAVYAVVHFMRGGKQVGPVTLTSGFERVASAITPLADPGILPGLVGFALLGLLLAYARLRSGALYLPIGLHVGWVLMTRLGRVAVDYPHRPGLLWGQRRPPIVSGAAGWAAILITFAVVMFLLRARAGRAATAAGRHGAPAA